MNNSKYKSSGSRTLMTSTALLVAAGTLVSTAFNPFAGGKRARLAESLNNVRQVKFALDGFATDFDGQYPNDDTGEQVIDGGTGTLTSNDYFQQLFMSGNTQSEVIFWVKNASVCNKKKPDDIIAEGRRPVLKATLQAGDCGWAYVRDQTNTSNLSRPLIIDAYKSGTKDFDKKIWDNKAIVLRIDGSAKPMALNDEGKIIVDKQDILTANSKPWEGTGEDPVKLLVQPEPAGGDKAAAPEAK